MDSSNLAPYPEALAALGTDEELMLLLVLLCNSEASKAPISAVESEPSPFSRQNFHGNLWLAKSSHLIRGRL
jgi:hypothetical protein